MLHSVFDSLGRLVARAPRRTILVWLVLTVVCAGVAFTGVTGETLFERLSTGNPSVPGSESAEAERILPEASTAGPSLTLVVEGASPTELDLADAVAAAREELLAVEGVAGVIDPYLLPEGPTSPAAAPLVAKDGSGFLVVVDLDEDEHR